MRCRDCDIALASLAPSALAIQAGVRAFLVIEMERLSLSRQRPMVLADDAGSTHAFEKSSRSSPPPRTAARRHLGSNGPGRPHRTIPGAHRLPIRERGREWYDAALCRFDASWQSL